MSAEVRSIAIRAQGALDAWWGASREDRGRVLVAIADELEAAASDLVAIGDMETHLGVPRLSGEVARTTFQLRMFATALGAGDILCSEVDPAVLGPPPEGHPKLERIYVPLGVVAVFGASNFPFAFGVLGGDTASALAAGCAVVVKEHPAHPELSKDLVALARDALAKSGAPADLLCSVSGLDEGIALVTEPRIKAVGFTGSLAGGRALIDVAARRSDPIPFYGELSSLNPVVITPSAAAERSDVIAAGFVESMTLSGGQFCTKPAVLLAPRSAGFAARVRALISQMPSVALLTPDIASRYTESIHLLAEQSGINVSQAVSTGAVATAVAPAVIEAEIEAFLDADSPLRHECFGPSAVVLQYDDPLQALQALSIAEGVLVGCVHGEDGEDLAADFLRVLERRAGRVVWNGWPTGVAVTAQQMHGGPWPASSAAIHTSVGLHAAHRFARPVALQDWPTWLPVEGRASAE